MQFSNQCQWEDLNKLNGHPVCLFQLQSVAWRKERLEKIKAYCVAPLENADDLDISLGIGGKGNRTRTKSDSVLERNSAPETRKV